VDDVVKELLRLGLPGVVILALGYAYWKQSRELRKVETARVEDAKSVTTILLGVQDKFRETLDAVRTTIAGQHPVLERLETLLRDVKDSLLRGRR
jgi:hypothetical protein